MFKVPLAKDSELALRFYDIDVERIAADRDAIYSGNGVFCRRLGKGTLL